MNVVGITRGKSKKTGNDYTVLHLVGEFDDFVGAYSSGQKAENIYVAKYLSVDVGDEVELVYGVGFKGMAVVSDVRLIEYV